MITKQSLMLDLERMGVNPSDSVLFHSSMKAIGPVEGRADAVLDALSEYLAPGLLALPTLTWATAYQKPPVYDVLESPSLTGLLTELFRKRPGVKRSLHPTHSLAALGRDATELVSEDGLCHTPCGKRSGWHKLLERDAKILMAGCGLTSCTFMHGVEEWCEVPNRFEPPVRFTVITADRMKIEFVSAPHLGSPSEQYGRAEKALRQSGALADGRFGNAAVLVISARKCFDTLSALLRENPHLFDDPAVARS